MYLHTCTRRLVVSKGRRRSRAEGVRSGKGAVPVCPSQKIFVFLISKWWVGLHVSPEMHKTHGEFYAFPEIHVFIDTVTVLTTCFEHIFFKKGHLIKRAGVWTPWTVDTPWIRYCFTTMQCSQKANTTTRWLYFAPLALRSIVISVSVCTSVRLSVCVRTHNSKTVRPNFAKCCVHVARGRGSVLLWPIDGQISM